MKNWKLLKFSVIVLFMSTVSFSNGQCLKSWLYYTPVDITNNVSNTLMNYQVKITVNTGALIKASKMNSLGNDIRFVDPATCNTLNYWIESGINTSTTAIWVKLPSLTGSAVKKIDMYYGNSSASAASNGDSTFMLFDDFDKSSLDLGKWNLGGQSGTAKVSGGMINMTTPLSGRYYGETIYSNSSFSSQIIIEEKLDSVSGFWNGMAILNNGTFDGYSCFAGTTSSTNSMNIGETSHNYNAFAAAKTFVNSSPGSLKGIWQLTWTSTGSQMVKWPGGSQAGTSSVFTLGNSVQIGAGMLTESNGSISVDWIRIRQYASKEPDVAFEDETSTTSGIENQYTNDKVNIYPNPAHDILYVNLAGNERDFQSIQVLDLAGRVLFNKEISNNSGMVELSVNHLLQGIYFVKVTGINGAFVRKISVQ